MSVSAEAIANGNFQIATCRAVMPDGLYVNVPDAESVPDARPMANHFRVEASRLGAPSALT